MRPGARHGHSVRAPHRAAVLTAFAARARPLSYVLFALGQVGPDRDGGSFLSLADDLEQQLGAVLRAVTAAPGADYHFFAATPRPPIPE